ncbi:MAG: hypothetical protein LRY25_00955 [Flavobacterium sp.]|nr:hypothetical protein [Flavobacterium sp.]
MQNGFITLSEALKIFNLRDAKGMFVPFDIEYRTFNEQTKQGGKLKAYYGVKYLPEAKATEEETNRKNAKSLQKQNKKHRIVKRRN